MAQPILTQPTRNEKLLSAILTLFGLQCGILAAILGIFLITVLFIFTIIVDALIELCSHVAQVWNGSDSIERLLILLAAILFFRMVAPVAVRFYIYKSRSF